MVRNRKSASSGKSSKCGATTSMPVSSGGGSSKESAKSKKKGTTSDVKNMGETSTGRGAGKQKEPPPPVSETLPSTSTRIITTPSRYNHPFLRSSVKRPARNQSPIPAPTPEKAKEKEKEKEKEKAGKAAPPKTERKRWEAWSTQDKNLFFEAISEYGKDFESVQKSIEHKHKKLGYPPNQIKNKDQVRHLYYRTCHKLLKYVTPLPDQPRVNNELYALINYGELRKKLKGGLTPKNARKLDELVSQGFTCIRFKGRNIKVKTPVCKAMKKLKNPEKDEEKPTKLPARVLLELQPKNNAAWAEVQSVAHNPRLRLMVPLQKDMGSLLQYLSEKWTPHRIRLLHSLKPADKGYFNQVQLNVTKGASITPYSKLHGRFIHENCKTPFTIVSEDAKTKQEESPNKVVSPSSKKTTPKGKNKKDGTSTDVVVHQDGTDCLLHPDLDGSLEPMSVDLLEDHHHPSEHLISDPGGLSSMFEDHPPLGELLSTNDDGLSFNSLSLTFSGSNASALSLAPHSADILSQAVSIATIVSVGEPHKVTGAGDASDSSMDLKYEIKVEEAVVEEKEPLPKDVLLKEGLTASTGSGISVTDMYLMMGRPETLKFEYEFLKKKQPISDPSCEQMMKKLVHLAKTSFSEVDKPKKEFVSVGVVTSPLRSNTPPSKCNQGGANRSPSGTGRSPRGSGTRGASRNNSSSNKTQGKAVAGEKQDGTRDEESREEEGGVHFAVPRSVAPTALRRNQEPSHALAGQQMLHQLEQMKRPQANFLLPRMKKRQRGVKPIVVQRTILPRPQLNDGQGDKMVSMAIINSSQANMGHFMPVKVNMSSLGSVVTSRVQPRPIRPNVLGVSSASGNTEGIAQTTTVASSASESGKMAVRRIVPMNVTNSSVSGGNIIPVSLSNSLSPAASPLMVSSPTPDSQVNQVSTSQLANSPAPSTSSPQPLGTSTPARGSPLPDATADSSIVIIDQGTATPAHSRHHMDMGPATPVLSADHMDTSPATPVLSGQRMDASLLHTPVVQEIELVPMAGMGDSLMDSSMLDQTLVPQRTSADASSILDETLIPDRASSAGGTSTITPPVVSGGQQETPSSSSANPSSLHISAPEISALLDISLPASENGEGLSTLSLDSTTFKTFGRNISSTTNEALNSSTLSRDIGNISPTSSPFKSNSLGPEAQWYNGESLDISMSSLLGHLESPEKKDRSSQMSSTVVPMPTSLSVPTALLSESSRDSIITHDVDTTLQVMLNESSIDYVAKFADLAAHISSTPDTPHKNIIDKVLQADESPMEKTAQLQLPATDTTAGVDE